MGRLFILSETVFQACRNFLESVQTTVKYEGLLLEFQAGALPASDVPVIQGWAADTYTLMSSFAVSVVCYLYIVFFAVYGYRADE